MIPVQKNPSLFDSTPGDDRTSEGIALSALNGSSTAARSERVNRTHRVVHERAKTIAARRSKVRSLWLPLVIFSALLVSICVAVWSVLDQYELTPTGSPIASNQLMVLLIWSVPASAALLAVVWFRQSRTDGHPGSGRGVAK